MEELQQLIRDFHFANNVWTIVLPLILMVLDILTGIVNAWIKNEVDSAKLRQGLGKKFGEICILAIGGLFLFGMGLPRGVIDGLSIYIMLMELISICENLKKLGVPIPTFISEALAVTNSKINEDDTKEK